jgi:hypothetical protein
MSFFAGGVVEDRARWIRWRAARLLNAGFSEELAERLAHDGRVDIHALLELTDRGCPPHLAARIAAPLDERPADGGCGEQLR